MVQQANGIINPYGAGNAKLDSSGYTNYYLRQQAHKQATAEALDRYLMDLDKNVTPTGMRTQDIPDLINMQKQSQQYYLQNKAAIRNPALDNGKARTEYFGMHQDKMGLVQGSKNALAEAKSVAPVLRNPQVAELLTPEFHGVLDNHNKPLLDKTRTSDVDLVGSVAFNPKPYDTPKQLAIQKSYALSAGPAEKKLVATRVDPSDKIKDIQTWQKAPSKDQLNHVFDYAEYSHNNDKQLAYTFKDIDPQEFDAAQKLAKEIKGPDYEINTPAKAYAAQAALHYKMEGTEEKTVVNGARKHAQDMADFYAKQSQRQADKKRAQAHAHALKTGTESEWLENQVKDAEDTSKENVVITRTNGEKDKGKVLGMPPVVLKQFEVQGVTPDAIVKYDNGTYSPIFYNRYPKGDAKEFQIKTGPGGRSNDPTIIAPVISRQQLKAAYGKAFATGANLTGQFDGEEAPVEETTEPSTPRKATKRKPY